MQFGKKESTTPNFTPSVQGGGSVPKNENFTKFRNINALQGCIPCTRFTKFSRFLGSSSMDQPSKSEGIRSRVPGLWRFNQGGAFSSKFSVPHSGKTMCCMLRCKNGTTSSVTMPSMVGLMTFHGTGGRGKKQKVQCLFLYITLFNSKVHAKQLDSGKLVVVQLHSNLSLCC